MEKHNSIIWLACGATLVGLLIFTFSAGLSVQAAPLPQLTPFPTPTPGADGRILYVVQPDDTLWRIAAITGVSLDQLRTLNNLGADDIIAPGDVLLIGLAGPAVVTPTAGGPETPQEAVQPTPTEALGTGSLCVILYDDLNGDAIRQEEENWINGGQISLSDRLGETSETTETETLYDEEGEIAYTCFDELAPGEYSLSVAIPEGFNPTTLLSRSLELAGGEETYVSFGAQANTERLAETAVIPEAPRKSPILAIAGGMVLLIGLGLGIYAGLLSRSK